MLYGKYKGVSENLKSRVVLVWENVKPESKRVLLSKRLFGYVYRGKRYNGMVDKYKGKRLGKGMIVVPSESAGEFLKLFREMKIKVRILKGWFMV